MSLGNLYLPSGNFDHLEVSLIICLYSHSNSLHTETLFVCLFVLALSFFLIVSVAQAGLELSTQPNLFLGHSHSLAPASLVLRLHTWATMHGSNSFLWHVFPHLLSFCIYSLRHYLAGPPPALESLPLSRGVLVHLYLLLIINVFVFKPDILIHFLLITSI